MEIRDIYNIKREKIGIKKSDEELHNGEFVVAVHLWFINSDGKILIQKRSSSKKYDADKWAVTGGFSISGEDSASTCLRETKEELGFIPNLEKAAIIISFLERKNVFVDVWLIKIDIELDNLCLRDIEVSEVKWVSLEELKNMQFETGGVLKNMKGLPCQQYKYMDLLYTCIEVLT
jgi:8-oxo-dGTP diphosphatase